MTLSKDHAILIVMGFVRYDDPLYMFRKYAPYECEDNGEGYPYLWNEISKVRCEEARYRCDDCGLAYLEDGDILTVHHNNLNKADCRRANLHVYCWLHHSVDHESLSHQRPRRCRFCKTYFIGWPRLHRHIRGIHRASELKIPEITLNQRPTSYVGRQRVLAAIQRYQRLQNLFWD